MKSARSNKRARTEPKKHVATVPSRLVSESEAGRAWLSRLTEAEFRDDILEHLFARMKKAGLIESFQNIHGRNDKGVDYILAERTPLRRSIIGIQVKSKPVTRTGSSSSVSSLDIIKESAAAVAHTFNLERDAVRLDNVSLWMSADITEDAEKEFLAPGHTLKIQVVKAGEVFALIERFAPDLLAKIPECALANYVAAKANPKPKAFKLLGVPLNPKLNFLAPQLTPEDPNSSGRFKTINRVIEPKRDSVDLKTLVNTTNHVVIQGRDLSGKSYLLEHLQYLVAEQSTVPVLLPAGAFVPAPTSVFKLLTKHLPLLNPREIEALTASVRVVLLIDDIDEVAADTRRMLFALDPTRVGIIATAGMLTPPSDVKRYHISGVDFASIPQFLRSLDVSGQGITFTDRAHSFIARSLSTSGLPDNPFTVAMLLAECQVTTTKFSTPTMGRLIERFIELQLGSHSDGTDRVDFETKREFLTRFGGKIQGGVRTQDFRKLIARHIHERSLPHDQNNFFEDLVGAGVLTIDGNGDRVDWSHPVINQFFWVKNLAAKGRLQPIRSRLSRHMDRTLAAIAGSQLKNAKDIVGPLFDEVAALKEPTQQELLRAVIEMSHDLLPSEAVESEMLHRIEQMENDPAARKEEELRLQQKVSEYSISDEDRIRLEREMGPVLQRVIENKFHVAVNLASVIVNARDSKSGDKERAVREILRSNVRLSNVLGEFYSLALQGKRNAAQLVDWLRAYSMFQFTDEMLGDPFLVSVFRNLLKKQPSDEQALLLLDLLIGCGDDDYAEVISTLRRIDRPPITYAFYFRVLALYFFRFHREQQKKGLRKLLAELRKLHVYVSMPVERVTG